MDLKKELMEFVEANNLFSLEDSKNAESVIDVYLKTYKKQCAIHGVSNCKHHIEKLWYANGETHADCADCGEELY